MLVSLKAAGTPPTRLCTLLLYCHGRPTCILIATSWRQDPAQQPPDDCWYVAAGQWLAHVARGARATVAELLHLGRNPFMNAAVIATAPLVLLMHATMPALTNGAQHIADAGPKLRARLVPSCILCMCAEASTSPDLHPLDMTSTGIFVRCCIR